MPGLFISHNVPLTAQGHGSVCVHGSEKCRWVCFWADRLGS